LCGSRKYPYSLQGGLFEIPRGMRVQKPKESMNQDWNFQMDEVGQGAVQTKTKPSREGWIFSGTT